MGQAVEAPDAGFPPWETEKNLGLMLDHVWWRSLLRFLANGPSLSELTQCLQNIPPFYQEHLQNAPEAVRKTWLRTMRAVLAVEQAVEVRFSSLTYEIDQLCEDVVRYNDGLDRDNSVKQGNPDKRHALVRLSPKTFLWNSKTLFTGSDWEEMKVRMSASSDHRKDEPLIVKKDQAHLLPELNFRRAMLVVEELTLCLLKSGPDNLTPEQIVILLQTIFATRNCPVLREDDAETEAKNPEALSTLRVAGENLRVVQVERAAVAVVAMIASRHPKFLDNLLTLVDTNPNLIPPERIIFKRILAEAVFIMTSVDPELSSGESDLVQEVLTGIASPPPADHSRAELLQSLTNLALLLGLPPKFLPTVFRSRQAAALLRHFGLIHLRRGYTEIGLKKAAMLKGMIAGSNLEGFEDEVALEMLYQHPLPRLNIPKPVADAWIAKAAKFEVNENGNPAIKEIPIEFIFLILIIIACKEVPSQMQAVLDLFAVNGAKDSRIRALLEVIMPVIPLESQLNLVDKSSADKLGDAKLLAKGVVREGSDVAMPAQVRAKGGRGWIPDILIEGTALEPRRGVEHLLYKLYTIILTLSPGKTDEQSKIVIIFLDLLKKAIGASDARDEEFVCDIVQTLVKIMTSQIATAHGHHLIRLFRDLYKDDITEHAQRLLDQANAIDFYLKKAEREIPIIRKEAEQAIAIAVRPLYGVLPALNEKAAEILGPSTYEADLKDIIEIVTQLAETLRGVSASDETIARANSDNTEVSVDQEGQTADLVNEELPESLPEPDEEAPSVVVTEGGFAVASGDFAHALAELEATEATTREAGAAVAPADEDVYIPRSRSIGGYDPFGYSAREQEAMLPSEVFDQLVNSPTLRAKASLIGVQLGQIEAVRREVERIERTAAVKERELLAAVSEARECWWEIFAAQLSHIDHIRAFIRRLTVMFESKDLKNKPKEKEILYNMREIERLRQALCTHPSYKAAGLPELFDELKKTLAKPDPEQFLAAEQGKSRTGLLFASPKGEMPEDATAIRAKIDGIYYGEAVETFV